MEITIKFDNTENVASLSQSDLQQIQNICEALVVTGGCTGVKGGKTIIHFDSQGVFQRIQLDYFPWVRRSLDKRT